MSQPSLRWLGARKTGADQAEGCRLARLHRERLRRLSQGPPFGGTAMQRFGLVKDYWLETRSAKVDFGRYAATKKEEDKYVFRVPMLRNVAKTAPYFHDGSVDQIDQAVRIMASVQLGKTMADSMVQAIVAFLESLTGEVPANFAPPGKRPET